MQMLIMIACGILGGLLFLWLEIPGGSMIGAALATILFLAAVPSSRLRMCIPRSIEHAVDICMCYHWQHVSARFVQAFLE